jgi:hypothetical protein
MRRIDGFGGEADITRFAQPNGHHIPAGHRVIAAPILGGIAARISLDAIGGLTAEGGSCCRP